MDAPDAVDQGVYRPRKDSYLLKEAMERRELDGRRVLDMGTGSGFLALAAAGHGAAVTAVDITPAAVETVAARAEETGHDIEVVRSDLFEEVDGVYDLIVFNPPYVPAEDIGDGVDAAWAGGETGRAVVDRFIAHVAGYLAGDGTVLLLQSSRNDIEATLDRFAAEGLPASVTAREQLHFEELVVVEAGKGP